MKSTQRRRKQSARHGIETLAMAAAMPLAAMVTLNHRLPMVLEAMTGADHRRTSELRRMTDEKVQTAGQMALSMGGAVAAGQQALMSYVIDQAKANAAFLAGGVSKPNRSFTFGGEAANRAVALADELIEITNRGVAAALRPAHRRVTANAKRLSSRERKER